MNKTPVYDGHGNITSYTSSVLTKNQMADMAQQVIQTDPKIKAMLQRDAELKTYNMTPDQVHQALVDRGMSKSPYQQVKAQGLNDHEANAYNLTTPFGGKVSNMDIAKSNLMQQGYSEPAAEKAILNNKLKDEASVPYTGLAGDLFSVSELHPDHMRDGLFDRATAKMVAELKNPNVSTYASTNSTWSQEDPGTTAQNYGTAVEGLKAQNAAAVNIVKMAMQTTGAIAGISKNATTDMANATAILNNPLKLAALKTQLAQTHPDQARNLESAIDAYKNQAAAVEFQQHHLEDIEDAGGVDFDKMYKEYKDNPGKALKINPGSALSGGYGMSSAPLSGTFASGNAGLSGSFAGGNNYRPNLTKDEFKNEVRKNNLSGYSSDYSTSLKQGVVNLNGKSVAAGYRIIDPTASGEAQQITDRTTDQILRGDATGVDLNDAGKGRVNIGEEMGLKPGMSAKDRDETGRHIVARWTNLPAGNLPVIQVTNTLTGKTKTFQADNQPVGDQDAMNIQSLKAGAVSSTSISSKSQMKNALIGLSGITDSTWQDIKTINPGPSGVTRRLNNDYSLQIKPSGVKGENKYMLLFNMGDGSTKPVDGKPYDSPDDVAAWMGAKRFKEIGKPEDIQELNKQVK